MIATDATQPPTWLWYSRPSCGQTAAAKKITGITIKHTVSTSDLTSGPKISLPPSKNILLPFQAWYTSRGGASASMIRRLESENCAFPCILPSMPLTRTNSPKLRRSRKDLHCTQQPPNL
uniref:Uncharacterized protein n=1 Tax=Arundo donax TaxID=35708 RepID=A0A0A9CW83_ARUDO